jgi:secretory phospholipase A2
VRISLFFSGTQWCGAGNVAEGFDDLGVFEELDKCCRVHDFCPDVLGSGESRPELFGDLVNNQPFTKLATCAYFFLFGHLFRSQLLKL